MKSRTLTRRRPRKRMARKLHGDYLRLCQEFPLRCLRSDAEYDAAVAELDRLVVRPEGSLSSGERDYLDTLTLLVAAYDTARFEIRSPRMTPLQRLKYLMDQSGMNSSALGRLLGNRGLASLILNGHRQLSKTHIRILSYHFKVDPGMFLAME